MRHFLAGVILAFTVSGFSLSAQTAVVPKNGAERAYLEYVAAWKAKDLPALQSVIADDYMTLNGEKRVSHKSDEIQEAKSSPPYDVMRVDTIYSVVVKHTAVVSTLLTVSGTAQGKPYRVQVRDLATFVQRDGRWQLLADQSAS